MKTKEAVGREYQHIEDLLILAGSAGGLESLEELAHAVANPTSMDFKWDGGASVFWGRNSLGKFTFVPKNQWSKGQFLDQQSLVYEIRNTGKPKAGQSLEEFIDSRNKLAHQYAALWELFESATPKDFRGFLNGDLMFTESPPVKDQEYQFQPNKVTYHVAPSGLGGKIVNAKVFVIVHGSIKDFGINVTGNIKFEDDQTIAKFNQIPELIVVNTQQPKVKIVLNNDEIDNAIIYVKEHSVEIDTIASFSAPKFTTLKQVMYEYAIAKGKRHGVLDFNQWLVTSRISENQKTVIRKLTGLPEWTIFWSAYNKIADLKHEVLNQIYSSDNTELYEKLGIRATIGGYSGGEGLVKNLKSGRLVKLINPYFRSAPVNPKFVPEI